MSVEIVEYPRLLLRWVDALVGAMADFWVGECTSRDWKILVKHSLRVSSNVLSVVHITFH